MANPITRVECLNAVDIFCDLSAEERADLGRRAPVRQFVAGSSIYAPQHGDDVMFMINEGQVQLYQLDKSGKMLTQAILEAGTLFGEMAALGQSMHANFAQALTPCTLCVMTTGDVHDLLLSDLRISNRLLQTVGKRLVDTQRQLSILTLKRVPSRLAWALRSLSRSGNTSKIVVTHAILASMIGANRETVTKLLNEFVDAGILKLYRGSILILNADALTALEDE
jgi:CRP/FNR family transcriptional regulator, cyclic AMP receptor protein